MTVVAVPLPFMFPDAQGVHVYVVEEVTADVRQAGSIVLDATIGGARSVLAADEGAIYSPLRLQPVASVQDHPQYRDLKRVEPSALPQAQATVLAALRRRLSDVLATAILVDDVVMEPVSAGRMIVCEPGEEGLSIRVAHHHGPNFVPQEQILLPHVALEEIGHLDPTFAADVLEIDDLAAVDLEPVTYAIRNLQVARALTARISRLAPEASPDFLTDLAHLKRAVEVTSNPMRAADEASTIAQADRVWSGLRVMLEHPETSAMPDRPRLRLMTHAALTAQFDKSAPRHLLERLVAETQDWEDALCGERPSLITASTEARARLSTDTDKLRLGVMTRGGEEEVLAAIRRLGDEAVDWSQALSGERPSLDRLLAQCAAVAGVEETPAHTPRP